MVAGLGDSGLDYSGGTEYYYCLWSTKQGKYIHMKGNRDKLVLPAIVAALVVPLVAVLFTARPVDAGG